MQAAKSLTERLAEARQLENAGQPDAAAGIYESIVAKDPANAEAVARLLIIYRKAKDYRRELTVINGALAAYEKRNDELQKKWLRAHPKAARLGRSMLKQFGGAASGDDRLMNALTKRKAIVSGKISGKPVKRKVKPEKRSEPLVPVIELRKARGLKEKAAPKKQVAAEVKKVEVPVKKETPVREMKFPSLFIITLRYLVALEKIDAAMRDHVSFLNKHLKNGEFLVAGRQIPRTGGIIIAKGKDRNAIERIMKGDPFLKKKLAAVDIVEFSASFVGKGMLN